MVHRTTDIECRQLNVKQHATEKITRDGGWDPGYQGEAPGAFDTGLDRTLARYRDHLHKDLIFALGAARLKLSAPYLASVDRKAWSTPASSLLIPPRIDPTGSVRSVIVSR